MKDHRPCTGIIRAPEHQLRGARGMSGLDKIEYVVVLMFENRSFDNVLGWLYGGGADQPEHQLGKPAERAFEGLAYVDLEKYRNKLIDDGREVLSLTPSKGVNALDVPAPGP